MNIIDVVVIYLVPTIPALVTFFIIDPSKINTTLQGTLFGFSIKAGGGVASYFVFMILALVFAKDLIQRQQQVTLFIQLKGDSSAVQEFARHVDALAVVLSPVSGSPSDVRFERFAALNGGYAFSSVRDVEPNVIGGKFTIKVVSDAAALSISRAAEDASGRPAPNLAGASEQIILSQTTTVTLFVRQRSDEPLVMDAPIFHTHDWVMALSLTSNHFGKAATDGLDTAGSSRAIPGTRGVTYDLQYLLVFDNETDGTLSDIAMTDAEPSGLKAKPAIVEGIARRLSIDEFRALTLELSKSHHLFARDSPEVIRTVDATISNFRTVGSELGYIRVENGVHKEGERGSALSLRANDTTFRIGPIAQGIAPGEAVALIVRWYYSSYWLDIHSGGQDWYGQRTPYPARLTLTTVAVDRDDLEFDDTSIVTDFTLPSGQHVQSVPGMEIKPNARRLAFQASILDKAIKEKLAWAWK
jgi:hypothetical protein